MPAVPLQHKHMGRHEETRYRCRYRDKDRDIEIKKYRYRHIDVSINIYKRQISINFFNLFLTLGLADFKIRNIFSAFPLQYGLFIVLDEYGIWNSAREVCP